MCLTFSDGFCIYFAGDTNVFCSMALVKELYKPSVAFLPIGGHFTMGPREAAKAAELLGVKSVVPMHYGTFPLLAGTPAAMETELAVRGLSVRVVVGEVGTRQNLPQ